MPDNAETERRIKALTDKKQRAVDLMLDGLITADELLGQKALYDRQIAQLKATIKVESDVSANDGIIRRTRELLCFTDEFIWCFISRVIYSHGTLTVYFEGIEKPFSTAFRTYGRGETYSVVTGDVVRI